MRRVVAILIAALCWALCLPAYAVPGGPAPDVVVEPNTGFTKAQVAEIKQLVASSKIPAQVRILRRLPASANGSPKQLADDLVIARHKRTQEPSVALVFSPRSLPEFSGAETTKRQDILPALSATDDIEGTPQEKFVELVRMATTRTGAKTLDQQMAAMWDDIEVSEPSDWRHEEPPSTRKVVLRWVVIGVLVVLAGLFMLFRGRAVVAWWRRRRRAGGLTEAAETAREKNLRDQAKADVLAFGQAIDAESMDEHDALPLWRLALEDYEEASRLLDSSDHARDHRKVIEICARGRGRLAKAQR